MSGVSGTLDVTDAEITITDNESTPTATLVLTPATIDESGATNVSTVTATLSAASSEALTLTVSAGTGVTLSSNKVLTIAAGQTESTGTVSLTAVNNAVDAADLEVTVSATASGGNGVAAPDDVTLTITDDDGVPTVSVGDATAVTEGNDTSATTDMTFTVTLSAVSGKVVAVPYTLTGTATADDDYTDPATKSVTIAAGQTSADITIPVKGDTIDEPNETVIVTLGSPTNATVSTTAGAGTGTGTITDDDTRGVTVTPTSKALTLAEADDGVTDSVAENEASYTVVLDSAPTATVTVRLTNPRNSPVTLDKTTLTFTTGNWDDAQQVTVTAVDDDIDNAGDERTATLAHAVSGGGYGASENFNVAVTVTDDDESGFAFDPASLTLTEGGTDGTYGVALASRPTGAVTVTVVAPAGEQVTLDGPDAGSAFSKSETIEFTTGNWSTAQTVTVRAGEDDDAAGDTATLSHTASGGGYNAVTGSLVVTVTDDDRPGLAFDPASLTVAEGGSGSYEVALATQPSAAVTVTLTAPAGLAVDTDGEAEGDQTTLAFTTTNWATGKPVTVTADDDSLYDAEARIRRIGHAASGGDYNTVTGSLAVTVTDDDGEPTLAIADASAAEGEAITFTVTRSGATGAAASVQWATAADASEGATQATAGTDYTAVTTARTLSFAKGDTTKTLTVATTEDTLDEPVETFLVRLTGATGATVGDAEATGTITDDDAAPTGIALSVNPTSVAENAATAATVTVTATVTGGTTYAAATAVTVSVGDGSDSAVSGTDYAAVSDVTITIPAGAASATGTFSLDPTDDSLAEGAETLTVSGVSGTLDVTDAEITITDNDVAAITLMPNSIEIPMGGQRTYQVMLSSEPSTTVKVVIEESVDGYVTCAPQELEFTTSDWMKPQTVMVTANGDFVVQAQDEEGMDSLGLQHTASGNEYEGVRSEMPVEILATESLTPDSLTISVDDAEGPEGDWLRFRVHLSQPSPGGVRVKYRTTSGEAWGLRVPRDDGVNWDERDYDTVDGVLRFDAGEQEKIVRVWARAEDGHYDPGETFFLDIHDPVGATLANPGNEYPLPLSPEVMGRVDGSMSRAIGTIIGEMPEPLKVSISVNKDVVTEGEDWTIIQVTASAPYGARRSIRIPLTCVGGTAEADDFDCPTGLTIHHGDAYGQAGFEIRQDDDTDDETFTISIGEPLTTDAASTNAMFVRGSVSSVELTVLDDDSESVGNDPYDGLTVSIADATAQEGEEDLWFEITLNRPAPGPVTFHAESESGTARSPNDYQYLSRREIRFEEGERMQRLPVWVHDDDIDEGSETMTVVLSNLQPAGVKFARDRATGTIKNSDPIPGAWLARFGRTVADQAIDSVTDRLRALRTPGFEGSLSFPGSGHGAGEPSGEAENGQLIAGAPNAANAAAGHGRGGGLSAGGEVAGEEMSLKRMLLRQLGTGSFIHTHEADSAGGTLAWWGKGTQSQFSGRDKSLSLGGDVLTLTLGADYGRGPWVAGVGLLHSIGSGEWSGAGDGELEASLTSVAPYAAWSPGERLQLWSTAGLGLGSLGVTLDKGGDGAERIDTDMDWRMAAVGARGDLFAGTGEDGLTAAVIADAMWTETSSARADGLVAARAGVSRLRLGLETSLKAQLEGGMRLAPKLELGVRQDGGDAETGRGAYVGAGLALTDPNSGIAFDLEGQTLISHDEETFREWGMSASLTFDPRPDSERGLSLSLRHDLGGQSSGGMQTMFSPEALSMGGPVSGVSGGTATWAVETGYGIPAFGERYTATPRLSYGLSAGSREYGLGWRLSPAQRVPDVTLGVLARRRESVQAPPEHEIEIEISASW